MQPGHIFPLTAQPGGVLIRAGHTEAGCDLGALAGLTPAAVICEIMKDDGTMARLPDLVEFAQEHDLKIGTIADLIHYRSRTESIIERVGERTMQHAVGRLPGRDRYRDKPSGRAHLALVKASRARTRKRWCACTSRCSVLDLLESAAHHALVEPAGRAGGAARRRARRDGAAERAAIRPSSCFRSSPRWTPPQDRPRRKHGPAHLRHGRPDPARPRRGQDARAGSPAARCRA